MADAFWTFTVGNVVTIMGGVGTLMALWWRMAQRDQQNQDRFVSLTDRMVKNESSLDQLMQMGLLTTVSQHERRLIECEEAVKLVTELRTDVQWIKREIEKKKL